MADKKQSTGSVGDRFTLTVTKGPGVVVEGRSRSDELVG